MQNIKKQESNSELTIAEKQNLTANWFRNLRDQICFEFEKIEEEYFFSNQKQKSLNFKRAANFERKEWKRNDGLNSDAGGGEISLMKGNVFEKVGVNISTVFGKFSDEFKKQIPGAEENPNFWASGISLVAHMNNPFVPAVHMNTRFICTTKNWFGGGADLNPIYENDLDTAKFHQAFKETCDSYDENYYPNFKKQCDEYFFIKHRNEARGVGGIFYDYLNTGNFENDFAFTQNVGKTFLKIFPEIVRQHMFKSWNDENRQKQLVKRSRYAEFNLIYDRGTKFGLMTNGNPEAILISMPPLAKWE